MPARQLYDPQQPERPVEVIYALGPGGPGGPGGGAEEPTLGDVIRLAWRHRYRMVLPGLILGIIAGLYAQAQPRIYSYSTVLEIGSFADGSLLQDPADLRHGIDEALVPLLRQQALEQGKPRGVVAAWRPQVHTPRQGSQVALKVECSDDQAADQVELLQALIHKVEQRHRQRLAPNRAALEQRQAGLQQQLEQLQQRGESLDQRALLLVQAGQGLPEGNSQVSATGAEGGEGAEGAEGADGAALVDEPGQPSPFASGRQRGLAQDLSALTLEHSAVQRQVADVRGQLDQVGLYLSRLRDTAALAPPTRSLGPSGPRRSLITLAGLVVGLLAGGLWALISHSLSQPGRQGQG